MRVAIGCDHGGFVLKENLKEFLKSELKAVVKDMGVYAPETCDYPDLAFLVAHSVATGESDWGIIVDGAGIGSTMAANKVPGIRAANCYDLYSANNAREHNNANVCALGGQTLGPGHAQKIVKTFLTVPFGGARHERRVDKIMGIERRYLRERA